MIKKFISNIRKSLKLWRKSIFEINLFKKISRLRSCNRTAFFVTFCLFRGNKKKFLVIKINLFATRRRSISKTNNPSLKLTDAYGLQLKRRILFLFCRVFFLTFFLRKREKEIGKFIFFCNSKTINLKILKKIKESRCKSRLVHKYFIWNQKGVYHQNWCFFQWNKQFICGTF